MKSWHSYWRAIPHTWWAILTITIVACVIAGIVLLFLREEHHIITLYSDGFHPASITIRPGDTVTFVSHSGEPFWPASNVHPAHLDYPVFDPQRPIEPDDTWSFVFSEAGNYSFHDHIHPSFTGTIIVGVDTSNKSDKTKAFETCIEITEIKNKIACWHEYILNELMEGGIEAAFTVFKEVYKTDPAFVSFGCHGAVHLIGEEAYDLYKNNQDLSFTAETSACGYGFFHGFIEKLLHDNPDLTQARIFCNELTQRLGEDLSGIRQNCFHGIGHGMVEEEPLPEYYWGNVRRLLDPALATCNAISDLPEEVRECTDGAFNGLMRFMILEKYNFSYDGKTPFAWCDQFRENQVHYTSCIFETAQHFPERVISYDLAKVWPFIEPLNLELRKIVVDIAAGGMIQRDIVREDNSDYFVKCRVFEDTVLQQACVGGVVAGFFAHGELGNEVEKARAFCASDVALPDETSVCLERLESYRSYFE